ncbi:MAG: acyl-CoA dehydrogenase C-terminal domain-containing protein [Acidimicrobiales bacterium]
MQALDLVTRKLPRDGGKWVQDLFHSVASAIPRSISTDDSLATTYLVLTESLEALETTTKWMLDRMDTQPQDAVAGATSYLELFGMTIGGWLMARRAQVAISRKYSDLNRIIDESNFFAVEVMGRSSGLLRPILAGASQLNMVVGGGN